MRPLIWVTLEEVALDSVFEDGRLVARTSARQIAERLGINPGTAAGALRVLRDRGLLVVEQEQGPTGRFGLSVYTLRAVAGLNVVQPAPTSDPLAWPAALGQNRDRPITATPDAAFPHTCGHFSPSSLQDPGQEPFELGTAS
jgi:hypothetical protein